MAALCRKLQQEEWGRLLGPCFITFAIPLLIPGFTLTLVAFSDDSGFAKFSVLHVLGMIFLVIAFLLIVVGCVLRCKLKTSRVSPASDESEESSGDDVGSTLPVPCSTHSGFYDRKIDTSFFNPSSSHFGSWRPTFSKDTRRDSGDTDANGPTEIITGPSVTDPPPSSTSQPKRVTQSARSRLAHDIEDVLETSPDRRQQSAVTRHSDEPGWNNFMSMDDEEETMERQRLTAIAAVLGKLHNLDESSSTSSSSSSSYSPQEEDEDHVTCTSEARPETQRGGVGGERPQWVNTREPVASLALLTASRFGPVDQGMRQMTHMVDSDTEGEERSRQHTVMTHSPPERQKKDRMSKKQRHRGQDLEAVASDTLVSSDAGQAREFQQHSSPPQYDSALSYPRAHETESTSSIGGHHSSDYSPSHGSYVLASIPSERQSPISQIPSGYDSEAHDEKPHLKVNGLPKDRTAEDDPRSPSPVPLKRHSSLSEWTGNESAENVTLFSGSRSSMYRSDRSEVSPKRKRRSESKERVTVGDTVVDTDAHPDPEAVEKTKKKKKKKRKKKRMKKLEGEDGREDAAEPKLSPSGHPEEFETVPLRSIMHPHHNLSHHVHWPDQSDSVTTSTVEASNTPA